MKENEHILTHSVNKKTKLVLLEIDKRFINDMLECINNTLVKLEMNRPYEERERIERLKKYRDTLIDNAVKMN